MSSLESEQDYGPHVEDEAIQEFYERVAARHAPSTPWGDLPEEWRAFYKDLMVTAIHEDLPVFYRNLRKRSDWATFMDELGPLPEEVEIKAPEVEAIPETDIWVAKEVLRWEATDKGVYMRNPRGWRGPDIFLAVPEEWGPTRSNVQALKLLDWMKEWGWAIEISDMRCNSQVHDNGWWFEIHRFQSPELDKEDVENGIPCHYYTLDGGAPTLALAICRAALACARYMTDHLEDFPKWKDPGPFRF